MYVMELKANLEVCEISAIYTKKVQL